MSIVGGGGYENIFLNPCAVHVVVDVKMAVISDRRGRVPKWSEQAVMCEMNKCPTWRRLGLFSRNRT